MSVLVPVLIGLLLAIALPLTGLIVYAISERRRQQAAPAAPTQPQAAQPGQAAQAAPAPAPAPAPQRPTTMPRWTQRLLAVAALGLLLFLFWLVWTSGVRPRAGAWVTTPSTRPLTKVPSVTEPAIAIRGPFTPGPSDWDRRNVIRWWEVIMPGNAPGWQPKDAAHGIPITVPWRKFTIRYQSGYIRTPHGSWPPHRNGWPDPPAERLLVHYPGATARDLVLPSGWFGELAVRIVNPDGSPRGSNYLWNADEQPHTSCDAWGSRPGYFQFAVNVPQRRGWTDALRRTQGTIVFEVAELDESVPPGSFYPAPPVKLARSLHPTR